MLGNWSFGDFFKNETIDWSFELLTKVYGINPDRLYASYYGGDPKQPDVPADLVARDRWLKYLPADRVLPFDMADNFWEMGDTGPCGPCSEIHYDRVGGRNAAHLVNLDDPDVLEIWNNVFMQYNREDDGKLTALPNPCIDTGMGLERIASVLAEPKTNSNYDTELFTPIFEAVKEATPGLREYQGRINEDDKDFVDMAYRVVADHIRTLSVAIADGAMPSSDGRGYVLRRILRRAVRYGKEILKCPDGFFHKLVPVVVDMLGDAFPELTKDPAHIIATLKEEEELFLMTLERGLREFNSIAKKMKGTVFSGKDAFTLYSTFGFPLDLTVLMAEERKLTVDEEGFKKAMDDFREDSKGSKDKSGVNLALNAGHTHHLSSVAKVARTNDSDKFDWDSDKGTGKSRQSTVVALWNGKEWVDKIDSSSGPVGVFVEKTPFYAEMGGQHYDVGTIAGIGSPSAQGKSPKKKGASPKKGGAVPKSDFKVDSVQVYAGFVMHQGKVAAGSLTVGQPVELAVSFDRRASIARNHTATHLLNFALRKVCGEKVDQKGSFCGEDKLRFDYNWNKPLDLEQLKAVEQIVNDEIQKSLKVHTQEVLLPKARDMKGLRAVFGEQYPDVVRVVTVGEDIPQLLGGGDGQSEWIVSGVKHQGVGSVELCGGTHVGNSKELWKFCLTAEEGVAKGVRRIIAVTGKGAAEESLMRVRLLMPKIEVAKKLTGAAQEKEVARLRAVLDSDTDASIVLKRETLDEIAKLSAKTLVAGKAATKALAKAATEAGKSIKEDSAGKKYIIRSVPDVAGDAKHLMTCLAEARKGNKCGVLVLSAGSESFCVAAEVEKGDKLSAKDWVDKVLAKVGGKGGGSDNKAQGKGGFANGDEALKVAQDFLKENGC